MAENDQSHELAKFEPPKTLGEKLSDVPSRIFDSETNRKKKAGESPSALEEFAASKAHTPIDGVAKGLAAFGNGLSKGITGIFTEPIEGAKEGGVTGFFQGVGKGLTGFLFKPIGGAIDFTQKTTEGLLNTPGTLSDGVKRVFSSSNRYFGIPLRESIEKAKEHKKHHILLYFLRYFEREGPTQYGLFDRKLPPNASIVENLKQSIDAGYDVEFGGYKGEDVVELFIMYLNELPEPLIPISCHQTLIRIGLDKVETEEGWKQVKLVLKDLPEENKTVLYQLCRMLRVLASNGGMNGMTIPNLATSLLGPFAHPASTLSAKDSEGLQKSFQAILSKYAPPYLTYRISYVLSDEH